MTPIRRLAGALLLALPAAMLSAATPPTRDLPPSVQAHVDKAYQLSDGKVGQRFLPAMLYLVDEKVFAPPVPQARKMATLPATKVFDNFYYLGLNWVNAWALNTPDGIVLFDTLTTPAEAEQYIEGGLRSVGLDPKIIKYIVITHGHADHFGGAKYLQEKYGARVLMSGIDWDEIYKPGATSGNGAPLPPQPKRDMAVTEGQTLTLGGTAISFHITPGHSPGTMSMLFPVTDKGKRHIVSFVGGTGLNRVSDPAQGGAGVLVTSMQRFAAASKAAGADVLVSSHPFNDDAWEKAKLIIDGKAGAGSPYVASPASVQDYYASLIEAVRAVEASDALKAKK